MHVKRITCLSQIHKMDIRAYWQYEVQEVLNYLHTTEAGLSHDEAVKRSSQYSGKKKERNPVLQDVILFISQFKSPLVLLLAAAVVLSAFLGERSDVIIILFILLATGITGFIQERRAGKAIEKLRSIIKTRVKVLRDGKEMKIYSEEVVPGDILLFAAG